MSVFTLVAYNQLKVWLSQFDLPELHTMQGIHSGIENTNYFVTFVDKQQFVLTLFEKLSFSQAEQYLLFMEHLSNLGILCPKPLRSKENKGLCSMLNDKPAVLVSRLAGESLSVTTPDHCYQIGQMLAHLHLAGRNFSPDILHVCGVHWRETVAPLLYPYLSDSSLTLLSEEIQFQSGQSHQHLPHGMIHADLFRDNALFLNDRLTGIIDFYFAGVDALLFDVAVAVNDWCLNNELNDLDVRKVNALLQAYNSIRPFDLKEKMMWTYMLRAAALRFWLSRLYDKHFPRCGEVVHVHDPGHFERLLLRHRQRLLPLWIN